MSMRVCKFCNINLPIEKFGFCVSEGNGEKYRRHECFSCANKRHLNWRIQNRDRIRKQAAINARKRRAKMSPEEFKKYRTKETMKSREQHAKYKEIVYTAYGGYECKCCGETERLFLSVDHVNNDGYTLRKEKTQGVGGSLYRWLYMQFKKTSIWPDDYQILCMNCNFGKSKNKGVCPHKNSSKV
jgi:hypothetical protein